MSVIIRLQNLPWSANAGDIRGFFKGLSIPEGGVHIVGGEQGDAFIAFGSDEDARLAMRLTGEILKGIQITLLLSSRSEMQKVIETARQQAIAQHSYLGGGAPAVASPVVAAAPPPVAAPAQAVSIAPSAYSSGAPLTSQQPGYSPAMGQYYPPVYGGQQPPPQQQQPSYYGRPPMQEAPGSAPPMMTQKPPMAVDPHLQMRPNFHPGTDAHKLPPQQYPDAYSQQGSLKPPFGYGAEFHPQYSAADGGGSGGGGGPRGSYELSPPVAAKSMEPAMTRDGALNRTEAERNSQQYHPSRQYEGQNPNRPYGTASGNTIPVNKAPFEPASREKQPPLDVLDEKELYNQSLPVRARYDPLALAKGAFNDQSRPVQPFKAPSSGQAPHGSGSNSTTDKTALGSDNDVVIVKTSQGDSSSRNSFSGSKYGGGKSGSTAGQSPKRYDHSSDKRDDKSSNSSRDRDKERDKDRSRDKDKFGKDMKEKETSDRERDSRRRRSPSRSRSRDRDRRRRHRTRSRSRDRGSRRRRSRSKERLDRNKDRDRDAKSRGSGSLGSRDRSERRSTDNLNSSDKPPPPPQLSTATTNSGATLPGLGEIPDELPKGLPTTILGKPASQEMITSDMYAPKPHMAGASAMEQAWSSGSPLERQKRNFDQDSFGNRDSPHNAFQKAAPGTNANQRKNEYDGRGPPPGIVDGKSARETWDHAKGPPAANWMQRGPPDQRQVSGGAPHDKPPFAMTPPQNFVRDPKAPPEHFRGTLGPNDMPPNTAWNAAEFPSRDGPPPSQMNSRGPNGHPENPSDPFFQHGMRNNLPPGHRHTPPTGPPVHHEPSSREPPGPHERQPRDSYRHRPEGPPPKGPLPDYIRPARIVDDFRNSNEREMNQRPREDMPPFAAGRMNREFNPNIAMDDRRGGPDRPMEGFRMNEKPPIPDIPGERRPLDHHMGDLPPNMERRPNSRFSDSGSSERFSDDHHWGPERFNEPGWEGGAGRGGLAERGGPAGRGVPRRGPSRFDEPFHEQFAGPDGPRLATPPGFDRPTRGSFRGHERFGPSRFANEDRFEEGAHHSPPGMFRGRGGFQRGRGRGGGPPMPPMGDRPPTCSVEVLNLPPAITYRTMREFLFGIYVPKDSIKLLGDENGYRIGVALIRFNCERDAFEATKLSGSYVFDNEVQIRLIDEEIYDKHEDANRINFPPKFTYETQKDCMPPPSEWVHIAGIPIGSVEDDVAAIFKDFYINDILKEIHPVSKKATGGFFMKVSCGEEAHSVVMHTQGMHIEGNPVHVRQVSREDVHMATLKRSDRMMDPNGESNDHEAPNKAEERENKPALLATPNILHQGNSQNNPSNQRPENNNGDHQNQRQNKKDNDSNPKRDNDNNGSAANGRDEKVNRKRSIHEVVADKDEESPSKKASPTSSTPDLLTDSVVISDVKMGTTHTDVTDFFSDMALIPEHIHFVPYDPQRGGRIYVIFPKISDAKQSLQKSGQFLGPASVRISLIPKPEVMAAMGLPFNPLELIKKGEGNSGSQTAVGEGNNENLSSDTPEKAASSVRLIRQPLLNTPSPAPQAQSQQQSNRQPVQPPKVLETGSPPPQRELSKQGEVIPDLFGQPNCVVAMSNVPLRATTEDIIAFMSPEFPHIKPENVIRRYNEQNEPTSDARVALETPAQAAEAVRILNDRQMFNRPIFIELI